MKFVKVEDCQKQQLFNRHEITLSNGKAFQIGVHPVMFGYRVIGGYSDSNSYEFNWCCGDNKLTIQVTLKILMNIIEKDLKVNHIPFMSDIKPWPKDKEFIEVISKLVPNSEVFPDLMEHMHNIHV